MMDRAVSFIVLHLLLTGKCNNRTKPVFINAVLN